MDEESTQFIKKTKFKLQKLRRETLARYRNDLLGLFPDARLKDVPVFQFIDALNDEYLGSEISVVERKPSRNRQLSSDDE